MNAAADFIAVHFELGFAGTASSDAAPEARERVSPTAKARQEIRKLGQFHLKTSFLCRGPLGEDVKDQLRSIDDLRLEFVFQIASLGRRQRMGKDHDVGAASGDKQADLFGLALADVGGRIRFAPVLGDGCQRRDSRCFAEKRQLVEVTLDALGIGPDGDEHGLFVPVDTGALAEMILDQASVGSGSVTVVAQ